MTSLILV